MIIFHELQTFLSFQVAYIQGLSYKLIHLHLIGNNYQNLLLLPNYNKKKPGAALYDNKNLLQKIFLFFRQY